ncbi:MAG: ATP-binding cassette domain-containing protein [Treponema sp.]|jgi:ABC-2 type transport system ATP-binding protein|nr:ATP-binding cassette domain-containing protein [Treponema sp.]
MIEMRDIRKTFRREQRKRGVLAAARSLFHRDYDEIRALDGVSFSVGKGEIAGFIGPNGAGKSTAIKIMGGILVPDSGDCRILGTCPWKNRRNYVGHIGVVFGQRTQLWWDVPVRDSMDLLGDIYKVAKGRFRENLAELSELLELGPLLSIPLRQLSLGQRMRCEIAASLLHDPEILFLDEPTIGLDAVSKLAVRRVIAELNQRRQVTVILTSHDMDDIEALTNRILLIGTGRILYDGPLAKIRARFDRRRRLELSFEAGEVPPEPEGTRIISRKESHVVYEVDTGLISVSAALRVLGEGLTITDMSAASRPIEEIIASLYQEGGLDC